MPLSLRPLCIYVKIAKPQPKISSFQRRNGGIPHDLNNLFCYLTISLEIHTTESKVPTTSTTITTTTELPNDVTKIATTTTSVHEKNDQAKVSWVSFIIKFFFHPKKSLALVQCNNT